MSLFPRETSPTSREADRRQAQELVRWLLKTVAPTEKLPRQIDTLRARHLRAFNFWRIYDMRRGTARRIDGWELAALRAAEACIKAARIAELRAEADALELFFRARD